MKSCSLSRGLVALLSLFLLTYSADLAAVNWSSPLPNVGGEAAVIQQELHEDHPYVALTPAVYKQHKVDRARLAAARQFMAAAAVSPEPNQLRLQDLRGVDCYPQPDNLEVCGAPDTTCVLFFTKSEERLPEIELTLRFGEGLEAAPFPSGDYALIDYSDDAIFPPPLTDIDDISVQNPEAPSFLLSGVTRDSGAVYICFGIQAECGADFADNPPNIDFEWRYTTASGVFCTGEYTPIQDFSADVIIPMVRFTAPLPGDTNLGLANNPNACQSINITQTTLGASAAEYIFTAEDYGFDQGIMVSSLSRNGTEVPASEYTIGADGTLTYQYDGSDGALGAGEVDNLELCYSYSACFANVDFNPTYTVVTACGGEVCTGPADVNNSGMLISDFPPVANLTATYEAVPVNANGDGLPNACAMEPYVFDIVFETTNDDEIDGDIYGLNTNLRACVNPALGLAMVEVVDNATMTVVGQLDPATFNVRSTQELNSQGNPTLNTPGTVNVNLNSNDVVSSSALTDIDGDGFFDDIPAGQTLRLRYTFEVNCGADDAASVTADVNSGPVMCQFTQVGIQFRRSCNTASASANRNLQNTPSFDATSVSSFDNPNNFNIGGQNRDGYNFGQYGNFNNATCNPRPVSTNTFEFRYTLGNDALTACPGGNGSSTLTLFTAGDPRITNDLEISNIMIDNTGDGTTNAAGTAVRTVPSDGNVQFEIDMGGAAPGTEFLITFDLSVDSAFCSPAQLQFLTGLITTTCTDPCNCEPVQTAISTPLRFDPEDCVCDCYLDAFVDAKRLSTGFTDETRTVRVDPDDVPPADQLRAMPGDTMQVNTSFVIRDDPSSAIDSELNGPNLQDLRFYLDIRTSTIRDFSSADQFPQILDDQLTRLQSIIFHRDGQAPIDIGDVFSGGQAEPVISTGLLVTGISGSVTTPDFPQEGQVFMPGFPNGGYSLSSNSYNRDEQDGKQIAVWFRNRDNGEPDAIAPFYDAIGGAWQAGDSLELVWTIVLAENPGQDDTQTELNMQLRPFAFVSNYIGDPAQNVTVSTGFNGCMLDTEILEWFNPDVVANPTITYDECDTELVIEFDATEPPADWYQNEYRPVHGIENFTADIPSPYFYSGGASFENLATTGSVEPVGSAMVDTANVGGNASFLPTDGSLTGSLYFEDAEFTDGVRSPGYRNFDLGEDDITTVGGTFPLLGVGGNRTDSLLVRIPLRRLCGDLPTTQLFVDYDWANRHLMDYQAFPYEVGVGGFWTGKVENNQGDPVTPVPGPGGQFYFPFPRLPLDAGDEINPHRSIANAPVQYAIAGPAPEEVTATTTDAPAGTLTDAPGDEVKTITVSPNSATIPLSGVVLVTVSTGGTVSGVSEPGGGAAIPFSQSAVLDSVTAFAIEIPAGLAAGEDFVFDLATDLLFCEAVEICITPLLGCSDDPDAIAEAAAAFDRNCGGQTCYSYNAGAASVLTTIADPMEIGLCESQTFTIQYFNDGSSDLANFDPIIYIPEGLTATNFMYTTVGGSGTLSEPTYDNTVPESNFVFGEGRTFTRAELDAALDDNGMTGFNPGQFLTITFEGQTGCDFTSGVPLVSLSRGDAACDVAFESDLTFSENIDVELPPQPTAVFAFDAGDSPLRLSCSEDGDRLILTASNVGKSETNMAQICVRLPDGISLDLENVNAVAPADFTFDADDVDTEPINDGGAVQQCFDAPMLMAGEFVCLEIPFIVGDIPCGPQFIGATVVNMVEVGCANPGPGDTDPCTIPVSTSEMLYQQIEIVPAVTANDAELAANCTGTPGVFDVAYSFEFEAESQPYNGEVVLRLFSDVDANGELDPMIDTQIGSEQSVQVNLQQDEAEAFSGVFPSVAQSEICPLLLVIESLGCECSQSVLPFPEVLPDFIDDLGDAVTLCPGEPFTFEGICADLNYSFANPAAGTVTVDDATGEATIMINPGFGTTAPEELIVSGSFGTCGLETTIDVSAPEMIGFGPYEYRVCNDGRQEVDLNIPLAQQEDIEVMILNAPPEILNPNSFEPVIENLQEDAVFDVQIAFNGGQCVTTTTLAITVEEAIVVEISDLTGCSTGFNLSDRITVTPATAEGKFQTDGDGRFTPDNDIPGEVNYIPGPMDREAGFVNLRYNSDTPEGPCGPTTERIVATIQLVDCGNFFWNGQD